MVKTPFAVFIPAYQAEKTLALVVNRIPAELWERIELLCIVEDGSRDKTLAVAEELARQNPKIKVIAQEKNGGYGKAVLRGLQECLTIAADAIVCLHADGQYPPEKMGEFVDTLVLKKLAILQGSRHKQGTALKGGMPLYKFVAGKILCTFENWVFGLSMTDYHSGYMFYSHEHLLKLPITTLSSSFDFDLEMIACARAKGFKVGEMGIATHYGEEESHLNPIGYGLRVLKVLLKYKKGYYGRV